MERIGERMFYYIDLPIIMAMIDESHEVEMWWVDMDIRLPGSAIRYLIREKLQGMAQAEVGDEVEVIDPNRFLVTLIDIVDSKIVLHVVNKDKSIRDNGPRFSLMDKDGRKLEEWTF